MKAYQLKIQIKNSKPPIWRRCIVPAGITFSHLSVVLDMVMGWSGYHLSEYEFYHLGLQLREEDMFHDFVPYQNYKLLESSITYINQYMEQEDWFTYTYDLGEDWNHRVTIEKVLIDYPYNYPQVLKYKGNCPPEDGGSEVMEYDLDDINEDLKEVCFITYGKRDKRSKGEIFQDLFDGKYGFIASKTAKNKEIPIVYRADAVEEDLLPMERVLNKLSKDKSLQKKIEDIRSLSIEPELVEEKIRLEVNNELSKLLIRDGFLSRDKLSDLLSSYTKEDLKEIGKMYGLKIVSSLKKSDMVSALEKEMLKPEIVRNTFSVLDDVEIQAFEKAVEYRAYGYPVKDEDENFYEQLILAGYINMTIDNKIYIPEDVLELYQKLNTEDFQKQRKRMSWLLSCFDIAARFYGVVPLEIMIKLFNQRKGLKTDKLQIIRDYESIPYQKKDFTLLNNQFIYDGLLQKDNYLALLRIQGEKEYYIPTVEEILEFNRSGILINEPPIQRLMVYFNKYHDMTEEMAKEIVTMIYHEISAGCEMHDVFDILNDMQVNFKSQKDLEILISILNEFWNNTRMIDNRGHKPSEVFKKERKHLKPGHMPTIVPGSSSSAKMLMEGRSEIEKMGFQIDLNSNAKEVPVYSMPRGVNGPMETKMRKIYPNDPCPCGSGKKYKRCCG